MALEVNDFLSFDTGWFLDPPLRVAADLLWVDSADLVYDRFHWRVRGKENIEVSERLVRIEISSLIRVSPHVDIAIFGPPKPVTTKSQLEGSCVVLACGGNQFEAFQPIEGDMLLPVHVDEDISVEEKFRVLASWWQWDTSGHSFSYHREQHPAYKEVLRMGQPVVPLILNELQINPYHWFDALETLTGEDPVQPEDYGYVDKMVAAWLDWSREKGLIGN